MSERVKRTALVTGGTRGIGLGIARGLARSGYSLMLCGRRSSEDIEEVLHELRHSGTEAHYVQADISYQPDRLKLAEEARRLLGRLDVLINNAGIAPPERRDILEAREASFESVLRVNLQGPYFLTQLVARWMVEQTQSSNDFRGTIVFVTSVSAEVASVNRGEYCISKAGLAMSARLWAVRLAEFGIPVYEVRPGIIATDMTSGVQQKYDSLIDQGLLLQPRWGTPEDVGKVVCALVSGEFAYSTGQVIMVDGGMTVGRL
jgi:3-oxoacyl-[acyl-carrier protein] reductase